MHTTAQRPRVLPRIWGVLSSESACMFSGLMLGNAIAYGYHTVMARMMVPSEYGIMVTLLSVSYVLSVLMRTLQAWVIKAVAASGQADAGQMRGIFVFTLRTLVPLAVLAFGLHWAASRPVSQFLHLPSNTPVIVLGVYTFSSFLVPIPRGMLLGIKRLRFTGMIFVIEPIARIVVGSVLVLWGFGVNGALLGFGAGNTLAFLVALLPLLPLLARGTSTAVTVDVSYRLDAYALLVLIVNICLAVIASVDQIAVKHFFSDEVAGNYAVAFLLGQIITMSTLALGWVIFARSATISQDDPAHGRILTRGLMVIGTIAVSLTIGYMFAPALAVQLIGGARYTIAKQYVGLVGIEATLFALTYLQVYYHISIKRMQVAWPLAAAVVIQVLLLLRFHASVEQILLCIIAVMSTVLVTVSAMSWWMLRRQPAPARLVGVKKG